jgi:hypothetical protein
MKVELQFEDEFEFRAWWEERERNMKASIVLGTRLQRLRDVVKHGKPTQHHRVEYDQLWALCREVELDGWSVMGDSI